MIRPIRIFRLDCKSCGRFVCGRRWNSHPGASLAASNLRSTFPIAKGSCSPEFPAKVYDRSNPSGPRTFISQPIPSDEDAVRMHVQTTSEEKQYFKRAAKHRDLYDLGRLMLNQGPRPDEVVSLLKTDVDLEHRMMYMRKGKSRAARRKLDLTAESCRILAERMAGESQWIFPSSRRKKRGSSLSLFSTILGIPLQRAWLMKESTWRRSRKFSATI